MNESRKPKITIVIKSRLIAALSVVSEPCQRCRRDSRVFTRQSLSIKKIFDQTVYMELDSTACWIPCKQQLPSAYCQWSLLWYPLQSECVFSCLTASYGTVFALEKLYRIMKADRLFVPLTMGLSFVCLDIYPIFSAFALEKAALSFMKQ